MSDEKTPVDELAFEAALMELEAIVSQLEDGDLTLEASLALFSRGQALAAHCNQQLDAAGLQVEMLTADGEIIELQAE